MTKEPTKYHNKPLKRDQFYVYRTQ